MKARTSEIKFYLIGNIPMGLWRGVDRTCATVQQWVTWSLFCSRMIYLYLTLYLFIRSVLLCNDPAQVRALINGLAYKHMISNLWLQVQRWIEQTLRWASPNCFAGANRWHRAHWLLHAGDDWLWPSQGHQGTGEPSSCSILHLTYFSWIRC